VADVHIAVVTTYALTVETLADIADLAARRATAAEWLTHLAAVVQAAAIATAQAVVHQAIAQVALVAVAVAVEAEASAAAVPEVAAAEEAAVEVAWADAVDIKH
jgi:hypothetical protein